MPRPEPKTITFTIDGLEVQAPENSMLVDAAKLGDVEIPVFCYEPKLGSPVGACRMCLVEIEGIPKLQTGCSTPVKDGMVVHTQSERVKVAQNSVVEFLLINHPLDCPVCDKGGECPLQDITFGWGRGLSRYVDPKRHFVKPLSLSPLIAIDRERCILCYRCVRFSQEISEDHQLVLQERGAHSYVSTFDGHPYVAPFSGNIVELCPVGALTSQLPLPRAAVGHRGRRLGVHAVPRAVQRHAHRARRARAARALPPERRRGRRVAVRPRPLRLPRAGRRRARHHPPSSATAASCAPSRGSARWRRPPPGCAAREAESVRWRAAAPPVRRGCCSRGSCARRWAPRIWTRASPARCRWSCWRALAAPALQARVSDLAVRPRGAGARLRSRRRRRDPRPAAAQGGAPPRAAAGARWPGAAARRGRARGAARHAARGRRGDRRAVARAPGGRRRRRGGRARAARPGRHAGTLRRGGRRAARNPRPRQRPRPARGRRAPPTPGRSSPSSARRRGRPRRTRNRRGAGRRGPERPLPAGRRPARGALAACPPPSTSARRGRSRSGSCGRVRWSAPPP